jgi:hypothetical protein
VIVEKGPGVETEYHYGLLGCKGGGTGRLVFRDVKVPKENILGELHGGAICFNQMMIPERLTSAAGCLGTWGALDVAVRYSNKRAAFGKLIRKFQAVNTMVSDSITQLDAARGLTYMAARAVDDNYPNVRRIVSEAKKFATKAAWDVVNNAMQIMGGIGYTDVYPIERALRDMRLALIWTGTSQIMDLSSSTSTTMKSWSSPTTGGRWSGTPCTRTRASAALPTTTCGRCTTRSPIKDIERLLGVSPIPGRDRACPGIVPRTVRYPVNKKRSMRRCRSEFSIGDTVSAAGDPGPRRVREETGGAAEKRKRHVRRHI